MKSQGAGCKPRFGLIMFVIRVRLTFHLWLTFLWLKASA